MNNLWITQNKKGNKKELHDVPIIHYFSEIGEKQSFVANEQTQKGWDKDRFTTETYNIVNHEDKDEMRDYNSIKQIASSKEFDVRPFILRLVKKENGNLYLVLYNHTLVEKGKKYVVDRKQEKEG